jgi:predicted CXXCH cytochrome family protein
MTQRLGQLVLLVIMAGFGPGLCPLAWAQAVTLPLGSLKPSKSVPSGAEFFRGAQYVGSKVCQQCHVKQYEEWQTTWHAKMTRKVSPDIVVGDFNNVVLTFPKVEADRVDSKDVALIDPSVRLWTRDGRYFFTLLDKDNAANEVTYEVDTVIGGNWDQHYEASVEGQHFPAPMRWAVGDKSWLIGGYRPGDWFKADGTPDGIPRKPNELKKLRAAEAKCAMCHETGFTPTLDPATQKWVGTPLELGIGCEKCHGPGSLHVEANKDPAKKDPGKIIHGTKDLNALQQTMLCVQCHGRNTNKKEKDLAFQVGFLPGDVNMASLVSFWSHDDSTPDHNKYFWPSNWARRNRQQWQDFRLSKHFTKTNVTCLTCHTFHGKWEPRQLRVDKTQLCVQCHTEMGMAKKPNAELYAGSVMAQRGVTCTDCHMAKIGWRTNPSWANPQTHWDVTSHTFMISKPEMAIHYGQRAACATCHVKDGWAAALPLSREQADTILKSRQAEIRELIGQAQEAIGTAEAQAAKIRSPQAKQAKLSQIAPALMSAKSSIDLVVKDGSLGFHDFSRARELLSKAISQADRALVAAGGRAKLRAPSAVTVAPTAPIEKQPGVGTPHFKSEILPILEQHCGKCHNPGNRLGGFVVTDHRSIMISGDHAPDVIHGNPDASLLVQKLKGTQTVGVRMPIDTPPLSDEQIQLIADWVKTGAFPDVREGEH